MISKETYEKMKDAYGNCSSWAIWEPATKFVKSNTGDMSWIEHKDILSKLGTGFVFVGLNVASGWEKAINDSPWNNDYKLRYALDGTRYWGSYITDIIKFFPETNSHKVESYLAKNPSVVTENIEFFEKEIAYLGEKLVLVALGNKTYDILVKYLGHKYTIVKIKHFSYTINKENYRKELIEALDNINI